MEQSPSYANNPQGVWAGADAAAMLLAATHTI